MGNWKFLGKVLILMCSIFTCEMLHKSLCVAIFVKMGCEMLHLCENCYIWTGPFGNIVKWKMLQSCCENVTRIVKNVTFLLWKMLHELWKMLPHILWKILHLDVTRIVKNFTTVSTSVQHRPKVFYLCYLNNIFSCISFRGGRNRINHREPLTTDHSSTLFSLVEAEKDIDIKVYTLFIYNNNKNVTSFSVGGSRSTRREPHTVY